MWRKGHEQFAGWLQLNIFESTLHFRGTPLLHATIKIIIWQELSENYLSFEIFRIDEMKKLLKISRVLMSFKSTNISSKSFSYCKICASDDNDLVVARKKGMPYIYYTH